jgi:hypothetical protein
MNAAMSHRLDDGDNDLRGQVAKLAERVAKQEGVVEQINGKVNWILGLVAACLTALVVALLRKAS